MSQVKRVQGTYTVTASGGTTLDSEVTVTGNLTVSGTTTSVETTNTEITDRQIVLNKGESGAGVSGVYSGLEIERGSADNAWLVFDESTDTFRVSYDNGSTFATLLTSGGGIGLENVVEDSTPQLGGALDVNGNAIISASTNSDIQLQPSGTGRVAVGGAIALDDIATPSSQAGATLLYAKAAGGGGSGVHFVDGSTSDELVSRAKAIVLGIIF